MSDKATVYSLNAAETACEFLPLGVTYEVLHFIYYSKAVRFTDPYDAHTPEKSTFHANLSDKGVGHTVIKCVPQGLSEIRPAFNWRVQSPTPSTTQPTDDAVLSAIVSISTYSSYIHNEDMQLSDVTPVTVFCVPVGVYIGLYAATLSANMFDCITTMHRKLRSPDMRGAILLSPSCMGKTRLVDSADQSKLSVIDGDVVAQSVYKNLPRDHVWGDNDASRHTEDSLQDTIIGVLPNIPRSSALNEPIILTATPSRLITGYKRSCLTASAVTPTCERDEFLESTCRQRHLDRTRSDDLELYNPSLLRSNYDEFEGVVRENRIPLFPTIATGIEFLLLCTASSAV